MKANDLNQLVEAATRKRQELLLTPATMTARRRTNPSTPSLDPVTSNPKSRSAPQVLCRSFLYKTTLS
ncbi:hypothetical protein TSMEX_004134 [Taenia solium]|eukprot:TsM_001217900 transcript=TsM_001217900 gene=TsM_001217900